MKSVKVCSIIIVSVIYFFSYAFLAAQEKLGFVNSSWTTIIPGEVVSQPAITSYGFCVPTDGRMISAFSNEGKLLWEKPTASSKNVSITSLPNDFTIIWDSSKKNIKLLNPNGIEIWAKELPYEMTKLPFSGRDGRFFISGDNILECYGMNGICRWSKKTELQNKTIPIRELPDGTIIVFFEEEEGRTRALRLSPFGKAIEEIIFSGKVISSDSTSNGIFIIFDNGDAGLFSIENNFAKNKWGFRRENQKAAFASFNNVNLYIDLFSDRAFINRINLEDGTLTEMFQIDNINGLDIRIINFSDTGLLIADSKNCYLYDTSGSLLWSAFMPANEGITKWNYVSYTNNNHLVFCMENWTINGYLVSQTLQKEKKRVKSNYNNFYEIDSSIADSDYGDRLDSSIISMDRYNELKKGYYGEREVKYTSDIFSICSSYLKTLSITSYNIPKVSVFEKDPYGTESALKQLRLYGTSESASYIAKIISKTNNKSYIRILLEDATVCGYDPDGKILQTIEILMSDIDPSDEITLKAACDAVYSICLFMGRPAFTNRGKDIIKRLLFPQYSNVIQDYAASTFRKIIDLDL